MKEEQIQLTDFIAECVKTYELDENDYKPTTMTAYKCSECGQGYNQEDKFCTKDGKEIIKYHYDVLSEETKNNIYHTISSFQSPNDKDEDFPYTFIDGVEKRGDGSGYWMHYIFQRKSDDKYFVFVSYDGRIEETTLDEATKEVTTVWSFEKYFD
jgi:hypothetical protein